MIKMRRIAHRVSYRIFNTWKHNDYDNFQVALARFQDLAGKGVPTKYVLGTVDYDRS